ncbi:MAG: hypothetical protein JXQ27_03220 [Acidobacteria bacterium]|nr:hypothetical protein [Acidobacteriota bacterium]
MDSFLYWTPRILGILLAVFISIFALDVFGEDFSLLALLMHLIPTAVIVVVLIIAWRWELAGGLLFLLLGVFYIWWTYGRFPLLNYVLMVGPCWLTGGLFLLHRFLWPGKTAA